MEIDPESAIETLRKLKSCDFGDAEFELVHHWRSKGKLNSFKNHCKKLIERKGLFRTDDNNHLLHLRLLYTLKRCNRLPPGKKNLRPLVEEALQAYSPIDKNKK